ncbi:type IV pilus modification protein PilV [Rhodoferax sp.]|uniref:type IV pilus modification protein PilV n=1 Tax=Rhodoferax sp. TaxID=50421 RepID=UPI0025EA489E|nr:type IV pilus modification protein PilV [Rhodoferax sp.]
MEYSAPIVTWHQDAPAHIAACKVKGFSLLEVLISIIILSFGLLGMVGLQATALQANREARMQSIAASLAREIAETMRDNKGIGLLTATSNPYLGNFTSSPLAANTNAYCLNVGSGCTSTTDIANAQMTEWLSRVDSALPGAHVTICVDAAPFDAAGIPQWGCTAVTGATIPTMYIKIGWTRGSTNRAITATNTAAQLVDRATVPSIIFPITAGNT